MFTIEQYAGKWLDSEDWTDQRYANAQKLQEACERLMELAEDAGVVFETNPATGSIISGQTLGGFRPQSCAQGAKLSAHKQALAVDLYDPSGEIDSWCVANSYRGGALEQCGIYLEHPSKTIGWSHWSVQAPRSKNRIFMP